MYRYIDSLKFESIPYRSYYKSIRIDTSIYCCNSNTYVYIHLWSSQNGDRNQLNNQLFEPVSFITCFIVSKPICQYNFSYWQVFARRVKETNKTINIIRFNINKLTYVPVAITFPYWQVFLYERFRTNAPLMLIACSDIKT